MKTNVLIADDDMDSHQLMYDILEIIFRNVKIDRTLNLQSFWSKISAKENRYDLVLLSPGLIKEEQDSFLERLNEANSEVVGKVVLTGPEKDFETCAQDIKLLPFLPKPFSLDRFEEIVKAMRR
ncbi:MAG: hypothetical protein LBI42_10360 [Chitinispirillales bacterium]|nr:hypothetical protein [Chitinispirillales bacterium]